jgi:hypothetical protein
MLMNAFAGKSILLMDGVGLGKTIQSSTFVVSLAYYRGYYAAHATFPGVFSESASVVFLFCFVGKLTPPQESTSSGAPPLQISLIVLSSSWCLFLWCISSFLSCTDIYSTAASTYYHTSAPGLPGKLGGRIFGVRN